MTPDFDTLNGEVARVDQAGPPAEAIEGVATLVDGLTYSAVLYTTAEGATGYVLVFAFADWVRVVNHGPETFREEGWQQKVFGGIPPS